MKKGEREPEDCDCGYRSCDVVPGFHAFSLILPLHRFADMTRITLFTVVWLYEVFEASEWMRASLLSVGNFWHEGKSRGQLIVQLTGVPSH